MHKSLSVLVFFLLAGPACQVARAQTQYKLPPPEVVALVDAPAPPVARLDPQGKRLLLVEYEPNPSIAMLAKPFLPLAGLRIDAALQARQRLRQYTSATVTEIASGKVVRLELPGGANFGVPLWSPDGNRLAIPVDTEAGVELWVGDATSGAARRLGHLLLNDILGTPMQWDSGSTALLAKVVPASRGPAPVAPTVPSGPVTMETAGKHSKMFTYQDLLENEHDEALFAHLATSQLVRVDVAKAKLTPLGEPGLILSYSSSPDGQFLLVTRLSRPFSYRVPYYYFTRNTEALDAQGQLARRLASLPVSDEVPVQGVTAGPRNFEWQPLHDARLLWVEALDGGDPQQKVPHRERLMALGAPFTVEPDEVLRLEQRFAGLEFTARQDEVWITEFDRERRWRTTRAVKLGDSQAPKVLFDLSARDVYNDPGRPVFVTLPNGTEVMRQEGSAVFLSGNGATPQGRRPFLDRFDPGSLEKERLFLSAADVVEGFVGFVAGSETSMITQRESQKEPPNHYVVGWRDGSRRALTQFADPYPQMQGVHKQLLQYKRADGVPLSGTLYLPAGTAAGARLPCFLWAYPLEYSDAATAGQVRASPQAFTFYRGASPLFFVSQGYAVLMDATMPIVGDPETMNETFLEQVVAAAEAAIHTLDSLGVVDPSRVLVGGHSYGAFMTANLLAHSDLFAGGIARSGAYNRTLTPFGFQSERRSFWEAPDVYLKVSPFSAAHQINEPILLIHGQVDNNSGTYTLQSERMYEALQANGATARLVLLPHESHGYLARESILHTLAEMLEWGERTVKPPTDVESAAH